MPSPWGTHRTKLRTMNEIWRMSPHRCRSKSERTTISRQRSRWWKTISTAKKERSWWWWTSSLSNRVTLSTSCEGRSTGSTKCWCSHTHQCLTTSHSRIWTTISRERTWMCMDSMTWHNLRLLIMESRAMCSSRLCHSHRKLQLRWDSLNLHQTIHSRWWISCSRNSIH